MFAQVSALKAITIHLLDDRSQQSPKLLGNALHFRVPWISQQIIINVAYQVNETLLLPTRQRIIGRIEIGDQNAGKLTEHLLEKGSFPRWLVEVVNLVHGGHDPHVASVAPESHSGFINMDDRAS